MTAQVVPKASLPGGTRLFTYPLTYRVILAARHFLTDLAAVSVFGAVVVVWEIVVNSATPTHVQALESTGWVAWWTNDAMIPVVPAVVAAAVFLMGLRIGTRMVDEESRRGFVVGYGGQLVLYIIVLLMAVRAMNELPGSLVAKYVPLVAAWYLAVRVRRVRQHGPGGRLLSPSAAGFTPSRRALLRLRGLNWLDAVAKAYPQGIAATTNIAETTMHEAAAYFLRHSDPRTAAYCMARGVDYLLMHGQLADAEKVVRALGEDTRYRDQPASRAAVALLLRAVGRHSEAHAEMRQAAQLCRRAPDALRALILESAFDVGRMPDQAPWTLRARIAAVWRREVAVVVLSLLLEARAAAAQRPRETFDLVYRVAGLPILLLAELREDDARHHSGILIAIRGLAFEIAGKTAADRGEHAEAADAYLDAFEQLISPFLLGSSQQARSARCAALAFVHWVQAGNDAPEQVEAAVESIRAAFEVLESGRGLLRETEDRAHYIAAQREVIDAVFDLLAEYAGDAPKAGELGVWLLESLHRSLTADLLAAGSDTALDRETAARLAELRLQEARVRLRDTPGARLTAQESETLAELGGQIDALLGSRLRGTTFGAAPVAAEQAVGLLDGRAGVTYQCSKTSVGRWRINAALVTPTGQMRVHTALLSAAGKDPDVSAWYEPGGILDLLDAGDPKGVQDVYANPLSDPVWGQLSRALLPEHWWDELCPPGSADPEIVIVPDGPLAHLPFSALPVRGDRLLLESAAVGFAPSFGTLRARGNAPVDRPGTLTVVTHMDERALAGGSIELEGWRARPTDQVRVIETSTREELEQYLTAERCPDLVSISVHGTGDGGYGTAAGFGRFVRLRDDTMLSTRAALNLTWPPIVLLGACWIGGVETSVGREPDGFPIACIQRGAETVLGGSASIPDAAAARLLANMTGYLPQLAPVHALRRAQLDLADSTPLNQREPLAFAGLACWSVAPAAKPAPRPGTTPLEQHGGRRAAVAVGSESGHPVDADLLGQALQRVLEHARQNARHRPVTTLGMLRSTFAIDDADWSSFLLAAELSAPDQADPPAETAQGAVSVRGTDLDLVVSASLARALRRAIVVREKMNDETVLPAHAVYAALLEPGSGAAQWIAEHTSPESAAWTQFLSDRIFHTDLPQPASLRAREHPAADAKSTAKPATTRHARAAQASHLSDAEQRRAVSGRAWENRLTAALLVIVLAFAPDTHSLAYSLQTHFQGRGILGVTITDQPGGGAVIKAVLPGSSAARAGLETEEVVTAIDRTPIRTGPDFVAAINGYTRDDTVELTVTRAGRTGRVPVRLGPLPVNPTPGHLGISLVSESETVFVADVQPGGPAQEAGLMRNDAILAIDGVGLYGSVANAFYLIAYRDPGQTVVLTVSRGQKTLTVKAILGS